VSITDELRSGGTHLTVTDRRAFGEEELTSIADRIDREHRMALEKVAADAFLDGTPAEAQLEELGYIKLPVDADGKAIHVGDKLTDGEYTFTVYELAVYGDGSWSIRNDDGNAWAACDVTHRHEPTVEDVLQELTDEVWNRCCEGVADIFDSGIDELVAEYAARLRLAGDAE